MEDIDGGLHPAVAGQSLDEDEDYLATILVDTYWLPVRMLTEEGYVRVQVNGPAGQKDSGNKEHESLELNCLSCTTSISFLETSPLISSVYHNIWKSVANHSGQHIAFSVWSPPPPSPKEET